MVPDIVQSALADPEGGAALLGAVIGSAGTLSVALITGLFNRTKFQRELLWDKRQGACNEILSRLYAAQRFGDRISDGFDEDAYRFYNSDRLATLDTEFEKELTAAHSAFQSNYLLLPPAFRERYERYNGARYEAAEYAFGPDVYLDTIAAMEEAREDLFDLARAELGIAPWRSRMLLRWRPRWKSAGKTLRRRWRQARHWLGRRSRQDGW